MRGPHAPTLPETSQFGESLQYRHRSVSYASKSYSVAKGGTKMLMTIAIILIILWLLGLITGYTIGNFIYILLVIAIILILVRVIRGRSL
jgi:hypothetical protein